MTQKQVWFFTYHCDSDEHETLINIFKHKCKRWCFQYEKGETTGALHYQGIIALKQARRANEMQLLLKCFWRIAVKEEAARMYCMKDETRVAGPWSDKDDKGEMPWDIADLEWRPWQIQIMDSLKVRERRIINVLVDETGGIGKSSTFKYALWERMAGLIPVFGDAKDMVQAVCSMGARDAYIIDLPRAGEKAEHMVSIWKAIEQIKNGVVIDLRYKYTELIMGSPVVWVFTNQMPDMKYLSVDRWRIWKEIDHKLTIATRVCC